MTYDDFLQKTFQEFLDDLKASNMTVKFAKFYLKFANEMKEITDGNTK